MNNKFVVVVLGGNECVWKCYVSCGKLLFCEWVDCLFDLGSFFFELVLLVVGGMYGDEFLGVGIIIGIGWVFGC